MRTFKLTRYFSLLSMILLLVAAVLLTTLVRRHEVAQMERVAEDRNVNMTQVLGNLLRQDIAGLIARSDGKTRAELQGSPGVKQFHDKLSPLIRGSDIAKVKIYSLPGITVFSTEVAQIGEDKSGNAGFIAARDGKVFSELVHRYQFSASEGVIHNVDLMSSYVPVIEDGRVVAVFEHYQDVTGLLGQIKQALWQLGAIITVVLGALYLFLLLVVRHAQSVLSTQECLLEASNRELDRRVEERTRELQQSEVQLRDSEARFRSLTEMSSDFYWESDTEHRITMRTECKREAADPVFFRQASLMGLLRWEAPYCGPDESVWKAHQAVLNAHLPFRNVEISGIGANYAVFHVSISGDPVFDESGAFAGYRGVGTDITARKQAETELSIAAAAFESQQSLLITDANNVIQRVNQAFTKSTGYATEDLIGRNPRILQSGRHDRAFYATMWKRIAETGFWEG
ncbi:MAG TPA: PAS domain S-box protein, partial [Pseudoxanthomonas sp.]|nr:PAS domain S-box protein [Pseudoxanthomonas sp.]